MITICINDRQHVITDEQLSMCQEIRVCRLLDIHFFFFSSLKNYSYCIFLVFK